MCKLVSIGEVGLLNTILGGGVLLGKSNKVSYGVGVFLVSLRFDFPYHFVIHLNHGRAV